MTNEQIAELKRIVEGAPEGATHYAQGMHYLAYNSSGNWMRYDPNGIGGFCWFDANEFKFSYTKSFHNLSDLREILELRQEVERLKAQQSESYLMRALFYAPSSPVKPDKALEIEVWYKKLKEVNQLREQCDE